MTDESDIPSLRTMRPRPDPIPTPGDCESLAAFITRLEGLVGTEQIRVPDDSSDEKGNIILPIQAAYLVDSEGTPHPSSDIDGVVGVNPYKIGSGNIRSIQGTYTKGATGTTGRLSISAGADDVLYFMYGYVLIGGTHAGAASPLLVGITLDATSAELTQMYAYDATADADEYFTLPGLGEVTAAGATPTTVAGVSAPLQAAIPSPSLVNEDGGAAIGALPRFIVEYQTMASAEDFLVALYFYSMNGVAAVVTEAASDSLA